MKTWAKVGIGCLAALLLVCVISVVVLLVTGGGFLKKVKNFVGNAKSAGHSQTVLLNLDKQFPFTQSADGNISEKRLVAYLNVCRALKSDSDSFQTWLKSKQGKVSGPKLSMEMVKKYGELSAKAAGVLKSAGMGPKEFLWTRNALLRSATVSPGSNLTEGQKQVIRVLQDQLGSPDLTAEQKASIRQQIADLKTQSGSIRSLSANGKLYAKYKTVIETNNIDPILFVFAGRPPTK